MIRARVSQNFLYLSIATWDRVFAHHCFEFLTDAPRPCTTHLNILHLCRSPLEGTFQRRHANPAHAKGWAWLLQAQYRLKHFCVDPLHPCRIKIFEDLNKNISYLFFQLWCHKLERSIFLEKKLTSLYTENCSGNLFRMAASEAELKKFRLRFNFELTTKEYILSCYFAAT